VPLRAVLGAEKTIHGFILVLKLIFIQRTVEGGEFMHDIFDTL
jgi:hypothetical protein